MKKIIPLVVLLSLSLWGCKQVSNNKENELAQVENVPSHKVGVLGEEEIERVVPAFSLYLKDSILRIQA